MLVLALLALVAVPVLVDFILRHGHTTGELTQTRQPALRPTLQPVRAHGRDRLRH
jgi:hypothetical protein